jgi:hypothetical protein
MEASSSKYWLINDVVSHFDPYPIYGKAKTEVDILHDHNDMMIVKDKQGNIFHNRTDNLTNEKPICISPAPTKTESQSDQPVKLPPTRKKKTTSINQTNLF